MFCGDFSWDLLSKPRQFHAEYHQLEVILATDSLGPQQPSTACLIHIQAVPLLLHHAWWEKKTCFSHPNESQN